MNLEEFSRPDVQERLKGVILANMFNNPQIPKRYYIRLGQI
jgi:hypothetical protein